MENGCPFSICRLIYSTAEQRAWYTYEFAQLAFSTAVFTLFPGAIPEGAGQVSQRRTCGE